MDGEKVITDKLDRLLERYGSNERAYAVIENAKSAVGGIYKAAEECLIGNVLDRVAALGRYREYCMESGLPNEVCTELTNALWIIKAEIPEILQEKCGCTLRKYY
jgi:hypothetical protein